MRPGFRPSVFVDIFAVANTSLKCKSSHPEFMTCDHQLDHTIAISLLPSSRHPNRTEVKNPFNTSFCAGDTCSPKPYCGVIAAEQRPLRRYLNDSDHDVKSGYRIPTRKTLLSFPSNWMLVYGIPINSGPAYIPLLLLL